MTSRLSQVTLDVHDVAVMAELWSAVLGYTVEMGDDGCAMLNPPQGGEPTVWLQAGAGPKVDKLRCHMDLRTIDPAAEAARLMGLGARRVDVGQGDDARLDVLADPEGNEFCVLHRSAPIVPSDVGAAVDPA